MARDIGVSLRPGEWGEGTQDSEVLSVKLEDVKKKKISAHDTSFLLMQYLRNQN